MSRRKVAWTCSPIPVISVRSVGSSSRGNCHIVSIAADYNIMLDAGIPLRELWKQGMAIRSIRAAFITHSHGDHSKAVEELLKLGVPCYMLRETAGELGVASNHYVKLLPEDGFVRFEGETPWIVRAFRLEHDVPCVGFYLCVGNERLVYITDTYYCRYTFKDLTHILVEANYSVDILNQRYMTSEMHSKMRKRLLHSHFSIDNAIEWLLANDLSKVKEIRLLHLSDNNSDADLFIRKVENATGKYVTVADA